MSSNGQKKSTLDTVLEYWWLWVGVVLITLLLNLGNVVKAVDPQPLSYENSRLTVLHSVLRPGETLTTVGIRCNHLSESITYRIHRQWVRVDEDGADTPPIPLPDTVLSAEPGCARTFSRRNVVPEAITDGVWVIQGEAIVQGKLREWHVPYETEPFEVRPR